MASFGTDSPLVLLLPRAQCETDIASIVSIQLKTFECLPISEMKDGCLL